MVKVLLVYDGDKNASCILSLLSDTLQVELTLVRSVMEGKEKFKAICPDIVLIPFTCGDDPELKKITGWQKSCAVQGHHPGFILYSVQKDDLLFFDISQGSHLFPQTQAAYQQVIALMRQVQGRSKVERSLRDDYDHHNRVISSMPLSCLEIDNGIITRTNPAFLQMSGYDEHEVIGCSPASFFLWQDDTDGSIFTSPSSKPLEGVIREKLGVDIPCHVMINPGDSGIPGDGIWFIEDRREYTSLSSVLKETEYECREQLYLAETIVIRLLPDGTISFANLSASKCFGYDPGTLTGSPVSVLFPPVVTADENPADLFLEVSDSSSSALHIFEHCKKNGGHLWIAWTSRGLYNAENELTGVICVGTDMTEYASNGRERISTRAWRDRILTSTDITPEVFDAVLQACMEIGREGREGKPVGTSFIVGDADEVLKLSRQLILNPFSGHPPELRMVSVPDVREMLKEYALLDGAFVVSGEGLLEAAGRYITVDTSLVSLPKGMGTRHSSVAALTSVTDSVGFVVSESGGKVSIIKKGRIVKVIA
jgi:DNA integrity scanning protein DisA with diadenylate cyclase activity/PAS domain-containing protein